MRILFDHNFPFFLAHGGFQTQIEQTKSALEKIGVEVEFVRWWDDAQRGDIIHYFGRPGEDYVDFAHQKGFKVVAAELHTGLGSRNKYARLSQKTLMRLCQKVLPSAFTAKLSWKTYRKADAFIALTTWEAELIRTMFDADPQKIHVVPNGVEEEFFLPREDQSTPQKDYLVCTATVTERKRVVELVEAALIAQTPIWIVGKPYAENDPYYQKFLELYRKNSGLICYEGPISDRRQLASVYRESRGFVLLSTQESLPLSALEASASGCQLLLSDLPWARSVFTNEARFCPIDLPRKTASHLRAFYDQPPLPRNMYRPSKWVDVASQLKTIYEGLSRISR